MQFTKYNIKGDYDLVLSEANINEFNDIRFNNRRSKPAIILNRIRFNAVGLGDSVELDETAYVVTNADYEGNLYLILV